MLNARMSETTKLHSERAQCCQSVKRVERVALLTAAGQRRYFFILKYLRDDHFVCSTPAVSIHTSMARMR